LERPGRTFGTSIAILASVMLFSIFPLLDLILLLLFRFRMGNPGGSFQDTFGGAYFSGSNFSGMSGPELLIHVVLGLSYLVLAVFAWRGRPPWIRRAIIVMVIVQMGFTIVTAFAPLTAQPSLAGGFDSGGPVIRSFVVSRLVAGGLISLYTLWYLNRAPARAYFRGYYLPRPADSTEHSPTEITSEAS